MRLPKAMTTIDSAGSGGEIGLGRGVVGRNQQRLVVRWQWLTLAVLIGMTWACPQLAAAEDTHVLTRMLRDSKNGEVRARAAAALGWRREVDKRPELESALADAQPVVRAAAARALGRIGSRASLTPLQEVARDHVKTVAHEARQAIQSIETQSPSQSTDAVQADGSAAPGPAVVDVTDSRRARFGLMVGEMRNQSEYVEAELVHSLGSAVERNLRGLNEVAVFGTAHVEQVRAAQARGLGVFRMDGSVTSLSATTLDGQLWMHCEVLLLVMDRATGLLRSVLKGAARGVEVPTAEIAQQKRTMAQRVVGAAVRSALRDANGALGDALQRAHVTNSLRNQHL
jgi:hypothetical protein